MNVLEATITRDGVATVTREGEAAMAVTGPGDLAFARQALVRAVQQIVSEDGEGCEVILDDVAARFHLTVDADGQVTEMQAASHDAPAPVRQAQWRPTSGNPFLPPPAAPVAEERIEPDPLLGDAVEMVGLSSPRMARDVAPAAPFPATPTVTEDTVWLLGASGGVGVSTLAALAGEHVVDGGLFPPGWQTPVFVVAATHATGLEAAAELARANARGDLTYDIHGLILVHDRPKLPRQIVQLAKQVGGIYPRIMTIPYMPGWRDTDTPDPGNNIRVRRVIAALTPKKRKQK